MLYQPLTACVIDAAGRRTLRVDAAQGLPVTNAFGYNHRSEVTNAAMGDAVYSYSYDEIGHQKSAKPKAQPTGDRDFKAVRTHGARSGNPRHSGNCNRRQSAVAVGGGQPDLSTYAANSLNQYASVTNAGANVPVAYDLDGNMTRCGNWVYAWDGENRLRTATPILTAYTCGARRVENVYDHRSRRAEKRVSVLTQVGIGKLWKPARTVRYAWDGWNLAAEVCADFLAGSTSVTYYTWGLDLSGTPQGAGGVGGLLAVTTVSSSNYYLLPVTYHPSYDANGNVTEYVDASGTVRARYVHSAFGETASQSGDLADAFAHRFSTKYFDPETGLYYYGYRFYHPELGRWMSRDPIGEIGGLPIYGCVHNAPVIYFDFLGRSLGIPEGNLNNYDDLFDKMKIKLTEQLLNKCPSTGFQRWTPPSNYESVCCEANQCKEQAMQFADIYVNRMKQVFMANLKKHGFVFNGGIITGLFQNFVAGSCNDINVGDSYSDWTKCNGLKCGGWAEMASESLSETFNNLKNRKSVCWHSEVQEKKRHWFTLKHAFIVLSAPNGSIVLDPWKTGGRGY